MVYDIIIIGAGASGLVAAITAARNHKKVMLIEHKDKVGKKILATGNGKCNYSNLFQEDSCYRCNQPEFPMKIIKQFDVENTKQFFEELGIYPKSKNGYLYPYSEQATAIVDVLKMEITRLGVETICDKHVTEIKKQGKQFHVRASEDKFLAKSIILCTGGKAGSNLGSDGSGYELAKKFGHKIVTVVPALTAVKSKEKYFKGIAGVRVEANCSLYINNTFIVEDQGELQLTNYGLSGIPIFQISRFAAKGLLEKKQVAVHVDFLPNLTYDEVVAMLERRIHLHPEKTLEEVLVGLFNHKLTNMLLNEANLKLESKAGGLSSGQLHKITKCIKGLTVPVYEVNGFEQAQVCAGGVDTRELNPNTLESKLVPGLYFAGEVIDVDGICGGYNLQWAWSSAKVAASSASINCNIL